MIRFHPHVCFVQLQVIVIDIVNVNLVLVVCCVRLCVRCKNELWRSPLRFNTELLTLAPPSSTEESLSWDTHVLYVRARAMMQEFSFVHVPSNSFFVMVPENARRARQQNTNFSLCDITRKPLTLLIFQQRIKTLVIQPNRP